MRLTNKFNLPEPFVKVVEESIFDFTDNRYSATQLLNPTRLNVLYRRYHAELEADVSEFVAQILGTGVHKAFEQVDTNPDTEQRLEYKLTDTITISGKYDRVENYVLQDYKTAKVAKIMREEFDDYKSQALIYAWLRAKNGLHTASAEFYIIMKDWSLMRAENDPNYPKVGIYVWKHKILPDDLVEIEKRITRRALHIASHKNTPDDQLPMCNEKDRWYTGDKYAVYKNDGVRALKVFDSESDARKYIKDKDDLYIEKREGRNLRCEKYCEVRSVCPFMVKM